MKRTINKKNLRQQLEQQQKIIEKQQQTIDQIKSQMELIELEKEEALVEGEGAQELSKTLLAQVNLLTIKRDIVKQLAEHGVEGSKLVTCMNLMDKEDLLLEMSVNKDIVGYMLGLLEDDSSALLSIAPPASVVENSGSPLKFRAEEHKGDGDDGSASFTGAVDAIDVAAPAPVVVELSGALDDGSF